MSAPATLRSPEAPEALTEAQRGELFARAALLGHDPAALRAGEEVVSHFTLPTVADVRRVLSVATEAQRRERQKTFFNPPLAARQRLGQGLHDRGEAVVFADGVTPPEDEAGIARHMPAHVKAVSVLRKTVAAGETWDVSVRGEVWGLDHMEELYCTVNVGELVLEPGARIVVRGNVFSLVCQRLVCRGGAEDGWRVGILPTPFSVDVRTGPYDSRDGAAGRHGARGRDGLAVQVENSLLGHRLLGAPLPEVERRGGPGGGGTPGEAGGHGRNGGMCKAAEVTLRSLVGHATVFVQAGTGLHGGHGGDGGRGGDGGHGTRGYRLVAGALAAAPGGDGGHGADGGRGGNGGNGGLASNVYVTVPAEAEERVRVVSLPSMGGEGGRGGSAGAGGRGGAGGGGAAPAAAGANGCDGRPGADGLRGRGRPAPWVFVNDRPAGG